MDSIQDPQHSQILCLQDGQWVVDVLVEILDSIESNKVCFLFNSVGNSYFYSQVNLNLPFVSEHTNTIDSCGIDEVALQFTVILLLELTVELCILDLTFLCRSQI